MVKNLKRTRKVWPWQIQLEKARFSELFRLARTEGPFASHTLCEENYETGRPDTLRSSVFAGDAPRGGFFAFFRI
jgi:hypothetical protein